jgi:hypothetical protein
MLKFFKCRHISIDSLERTDGRTDGQSTPYHNTSRRWRAYKKYSNRDLDLWRRIMNANMFEVLPYRTLVWIFVKIVREIKSLERWQRFILNSNSDLDLWRSIMKRELVRGLAILNTCVKFRQHCLRNKVDDKTRSYMHTYVHTYGQEPISLRQLRCSRGYIPLDYKYKICA